MQDQIEAVQRMQDYIEEHICETITLVDLARAALFSPWYSHRLFVRWTGLAPSEYIRRLRLSKSALKLRDETCRITDISFEMGFGSVDGYQRAFYREFGCNPREYANRPVPLYLFTPYGVKYKTKEKENRMKEVKNVFIQLTERPVRKVVLKRGKKAAEYFSYCEEVGCDVWGLLPSSRSISGEPVSLWLPDSMIRPGTYLMFQGEPFEEEDYGEAICEVQEAIKKYDPSGIGLAWDTSNPRIQLEPRGTRGYIELLAVKPL